MPFKRPAPTRDSSSNVPLHIPKRPRVSVGNPSDDRVRAIPIYILQTKLDSSTAHRLFDIAESEEDYLTQNSGSSADASKGVKFQLCPEIEDAEVIITVVHMRKRFERHVDWEMAVRSCYAYAIKMCPTDSSK